MGTGFLDVVQVKKSYENQIAVDSLSLHVKQGEFFTLLGPSGCGKTTLLRLIAGLVFPDQGQILLAGQDLLSLPVHRRPVNTVFQQYALFPHLTVYENIAFGLQCRRENPAQIKQKVQEMVELMKLEGLLQRLPAQISGGQKQRVALARALVLRPQILLLDEPLSALDYQLRLQMQTELKVLQRKAGLTFIFVTHDQGEALSLSDRLAVINHGRLEQLARPEEIYTQPRTEFVARFIGEGNLLKVQVLQRHGDLAEVQVEEYGHCQVHAPWPVSVGAGQLMLRPEWLQLQKHRPSGQALSGVVVKKSFHGAYGKWVVELPSGEWLEVQRPVHEQGELPTLGEVAHVFWSPGHGTLVQA